MSDESYQELKNKVRRFLHDMVHQPEKNNSNIISLVQEVYSERWEETQQIIISDVKKIVNKES